MGRTAQRHHHRRVRRRPRRPPGGDRRSAPQRRVARRAQRGRHVRPPSGVDRAPGVGAAAAHRPRPEAGAARGHRCRRHGESSTSTRPRPTRRRRASSSGCSSAASAHAARGGRRRLPLRAQPHRQRRAPARARAASSTSTVEPVPLVAARDGVDEPVSSTVIRRALAGGDVELATTMLGRPFEARGPVIARRPAGPHCSGFPTANVEVPNYICLPADGVYAGWYVRPDGEPAPVRDQPRTATDVLRARRPLAARGPPARLRRRPLRRAGAGRVHPLPAQRAQVRRASRSCAAS